MTKFDFLWFLEGEQNYTKKKKWLFHAQAYLRTWNIKISIDYYRKMQICTCTSDNCKYESK